MTTVEFWLDLVQSLIDLAKDFKLFWGVSMWAIILIMVAMIDVAFIINSIFNGSGDDDD